MNRNLTRFNANEISPWSSLRDDIWDVFDRFSKDLDIPSSMTTSFSPKIEVRDVGKSYMVRAEMPGMNEKDISLTVRNNNLILEGEKKDEKEYKESGVFHSEFNYGSFYRAIPLSDDIDTNKVKASYKNGILNVELEKFPDMAAKNKKIKINAAGTDSPQIETKTKH